MAVLRSEEHTSELQSPVVISYAVFCLKKKNRPAPRSSAASRCYPRCSVSSAARLYFFFFNDTATTEIYTTTDTLSLLDALPISHEPEQRHRRSSRPRGWRATPPVARADRKSTRLNSSHRLLSRMPSSA